MGQDNGKPQPGDLIEIDWPFYQHWALFVGNDYVIHVTEEGAPSSLGSITSVWITTAKVKKELLVKVARNDKWHVNNKYDGSRAPCPMKEIIQRAES